MRYWHPFPDECVSDLLGRGAEQLLVVPTYPQYATATTGSALGAFCTVVTRLAPHLPIHAVPDWHRLEGYLTALANRAAAPLRRWAEAGVAPEECALVYTAHSLPERFERGGDPYVAQSRATVAAVHQRLSGHLAAWSEWLAAVAGGQEAILAFQSKVGPVRWVGPELETAALALVRGGARRLAVVPVSFTCEHIETVYELDQELTASLRAAGASEVHRAPALNLDPEWLDSLALFLRRRAFGAGLATTEAARREQP
jgi:ferrochelatase